MKIVQIENFLNHHVSNIKRSSDCSHKYLLYETILWLLQSHPYKDVNHYKHPLLKQKIHKDQTLNTKNKCLVWLWNKIKKRRQKQKKKNFKQNCMRDEFLNIGNIINVFKLIPKRKGKLKVKKRKNHNTIQYANF